ncbi:MAG: superoxide dismutase family protein [Anditalea sp.]
MKKVNYFLFMSAASILFACGPGTNNTGDDVSDSLGLAPGSGELGEMTDPETTEQTATAILSGASDSNVTGTATFTQRGEDGEVHLMLRAENLPPGEHAVHLHENGDCSAPDATSAGGHWNPTDEEHGRRGENSFHSGDIENMTVGDDGIGTIDMNVEGWSIGGEEGSNILNKAVIIHAEPDDFTSQPSGAAGARIACGVIESGGETGDRPTRVP